jgi:hypothetical protein
MPLVLLAEQKTAEFGLLPAGEGKTRWQDEISHGPPGR